MTDRVRNYEDLSQYRLDTDQERELVAKAGECVFIWANKSGHPIGVVTAYVPSGGKIWMTATRERVRIKAIARDGRSSCVFSSKGTPMGGGKSVTYKGHTVIHEDDETRQWMYRLLARGMAAGSARDNKFREQLDPDAFVRLLDTPDRVVLEFTPELSITFDGDKMAAATSEAYSRS